MARTVCKDNTIKERNLGYNFNNLYACVSEVFKNSSMKEFQHSLLEAKMKCK